MFSIKDTDIETFSKRCLFLSKKQVPEGKPINEIIVQSTSAQQSF